MSMPSAVGLTDSWLSRIRLSVTRVPTSVSRRSLNRKAADLGSFAGVFPGGLLCGVDSVRLVVATR